MSGDKSINNNTSLPGSSKKRENQDVPTKVMNESDSKMEEIPSIRTRNTKIRTSFSLFQMNRLEEAFRRKNIINKRTRLDLSYSIGLHEKHVKYWFHTRRKKQMKTWVKRGVAYMKTQSAATHEALESTTSLDDLSRNLTEIHEFYNRSDELNEEEIRLESNGNFGKFQQKSSDVQNLFLINDAMEFWNCVAKDININVEDLLKTLPETNLEKIAFCSQCSTIKPSSAKFEELFNDLQNQHKTVLRNSFNNDDAMECEYWDAVSSTNVSYKKPEEPVNTSPQKNKNLLFWTKSSPTNYTATSAVKYVQSELCNNHQDEKSVVRNPFNVYANPEDLMSTLQQKSVVQNLCNIDDTMEFWDSLSLLKECSTNVDDVVNTLLQTYTDINTSSSSCSANNQESVIRNSFNNDDPMEFSDCPSSPNVSNTNPEDLMSTSPQQPEPYDNQESNGQNLYNNDDTMEFWGSLLTQSINSNRRAEESISTLPEMVEDRNNCAETNEVVEKSSKAGYQSYMLESIYRGFEYINLATRRNLIKLIGIITMKQFRSWLSWRKKMLLDPIPTQFERANDNNLDENVNNEDLDDFVDLSQNANPDVDGLLQGND